MNCGACRKTFKPRHFNQKYCLPCKEKMKRMPFPATATPALIKKIRNMARTHYYFETCKELGISKAFYQRVRYWYGIKENKRDYPKELVRQVCEYYVKHGKLATAKKFKGINIKSIVDRYPRRLGLSFRQIRWTQKQIIDLARMQGLVPYSLQAKYFDRPRANGGSIKSFWSKRMKKEAYRLHGLPSSLARYFLKHPHNDSIRLGIKIKALQVGYETKESRRIITWEDLSKNLKPELPEHLKEAIHAMAKFQRWILGVKNVRLSVQKLTNASTPEQLSKLLKV